MHKARAGILCLSLLVVALAVPLPSEDAVIESEITYMEDQGIIKVYVPSGIPHVRYGAQIYQDGKMIWDQGLVSQGTESTTIYLVDDSFRDLPVGVYKVELFALSEGGDFIIGYLTIEDSDGTAFSSQMIMIAVALIVVVAIALLYLRYKIKS